MAVAAPARVKGTSNPSHVRGLLPAPGIARKAAPAPNPPAGRRHLRVVDDKRVSVARRRRHARALLIVVSVVMVGSLFALAAFHAMLTSNQASLDSLQRKVSDAQARFETLRLDVAELEAPSRIVREAQERLGMVPPPGVTYLAPSEAVSAEVRRAAAVDSRAASSEAGDRAAWATVKPYLSGRP